MRQPQSKVLPGSATIKIKIIARDTIKMNAKDYHNQNYYWGVSDSKLLPGSTTIKKIARKCHKLNYLQQVTIK